MRPYQRSQARNPQPAIAIGAIGVSVAKHVATVGKSIMAITVFAMYQPAKPSCREASGSSRSVKGTAVLSAAWQMERILRMWQRCETEFTYALSSQTSLLEVRDYYLPAPSKIGL